MSESFTSPLSPKSGSFSFCSSSRSNLSSPAIMLFPLAASFFRACITAFLSSTFFLPASSFFIRAASGADAITTFENILRKSSSPMLSMPSSNFRILNPTRTCLFPGFLGTDRFLFTDVAIPYGSLTCIRRFPFLSSLVPVTVYSRPAFRPSASRFTLLLFPSSVSAPVDTVTIILFSTAATMAATAVFPFSSASPLSVSSYPVDITL